MHETTAVVTGASRGIGASVARAFANEGAQVIACARDTDALDALTTDADGNGTITTQRADVRDPNAMGDLMATAAALDDRIDLVVACAGIYEGRPGETPLAEEPYETFDTHVATNGRGVYATIREAVPYLADNARVLVPSGSIAREASAGFGSYAVSKATAEAIARGFAVELDQHVAIVDPGQVETGLGLDGRDPETVAPMFVWAASEVAGEELNGAVLDLRQWRKATR